MQFTSGGLYILTFADLYITPLYIILGIFFFSKWKKKYYKNSPLKKYILPAFICRVAGSIFFALIYQFYYRIGDTFSYYTGAHEIWTAFTASPKIAIEMIFHNPADYSPSALEFANYISSPDVGSPQILVCKIAGVIGLFCFGTYLPIAIIFSVMSFAGTWMILLVFHKSFPSVTKYTAICILFIPSVIVWTSGIIKEPPCMFALGLCFYTFNNIINGRAKLKNVILFAFGAIILLSIKDYILYIFFVALIFWMYQSFLNRVSLLIRRIIKISIYLSILIFLIYSFENTFVLDSDFFTKNISKAETIQNAMVIINQESGGSAYNIEIGDYSPWGLTQSALLSLNVSLFRPYAWECKNILMVLNFLESFITSILVLMIIFKRRFKDVAQLMKNPMLWFCLMFSILMAVVVGYISFNFGTLIRYKAPFVPFFYSFLIVLLFNKTEIKEKENSTNYIYAKINDIMVKNGW